MGKISRHGGPSVSGLTEPLLDTINFLRQDGVQSVPGALVPIPVGNGGTGVAAASQAAALAGLGGSLPLLTQPLATAVAATMERGRATAASGALTSGTVYLMEQPLPAGLSTAKCTMFTNTTAKTGGTHGWYVLTDSSLKVVAVTADQTDAATVWGAASTGYPLPWTAAYTVPATALYYVGIMVAQSAGGTPTISSATAPAAGIAGATGITNGVALCGSSSTGQTTPPAIGATLTAISSSGVYQFYAYLE